MALALPRSANDFLSRATVSGKLGWHQANDFQEEKNPEAPPIEGQVSGPEACPTSQAQCKNGSSQPAPPLAILCCYGAVCPLASEDPSGCGQGTGLEEAEPAGLEASSAKVLCLLSPLPAWPLN